MGFEKGFSDQIGRLAGKIGRGGRGGVSGTKYKHDVMYFQKMRSHPPINLRSGNVKKILVLGNSLG